MTNTDGARSAVAAEYPSCVQHEALINHAFDGRDVAIICPYDADGLGEQVLADAAMTHPFRHTSRLGLPSERLEDVALAVGELATNSIRHGGGSGILRIWADDGHVVCEVRDGGHIEDRLAGGIPAAPRQIGGYGLLIVNDLADLVRTHTGPAGTAIRLHFLVRQSSPTAHDGRSNFFRLQPHRSRFAGYPVGLVAHTGGHDDNTNGGRHS